MVHLKEFQQDDRLYLYVVNMKGTKSELGSSFLVRRPLCRPKTNQVPTFEPFAFSRQFSIRVEKDAKDGSITYYL